MKIHKGLCAFLAAFIAVGLSCTKEKIVEVSAEPPTVTVTGKVCAWYCAVGDYLNNSGPEHRYTVNTGLPATVKFVRNETCCTFSGQTDDSSQYVAKPEVGDYFAVVETYHAHPDTIMGISLTKDTVIDFDVVYEMAVGDTVYITYSYGTADDSAGYAAEWYYVDMFNTWIGDMLDLPNTERVFITLLDPNLFVEYHIPVKPEYAAWQVWDKSLMIMLFYDLPDNFDFNVARYYCMF
jgi:hypothetical protein